VLGPSTSREESGVDLARYGPWTVIAGGSEGVGSAFAAKLASEGFNLVLIGRKVEPLEETAQQARAEGVEVRTLPLDLTASVMEDRVRAVTDDVEVGLLIYNAGANAYGTSFVDGELARFRTVVDLNTISRLALCHHFGGRMKQRRKGGILLVGSFSGYNGSPYTSVYNAAKAFSRVFAESLWFELRDYDVDVVEFVVGGIRTPAMARRGMIFGPETSEPADIAQEGLDHIGDGPVWNSEAAGGVGRAKELSGWPRDPVISAAGEGLRRLGLYT
jgi:short-subunit dehydrogenase